MFVWVLGRTRRRERVVLRVEFFVAEELIRGSVEIVRPALGDDIDLSRAAAELSRIDSCLNLKFLKRVDRGLNDIGVEVRICILDAVKREMVELRALARNCE